MKNFNSSPRVGLLFFLLVSYLGLQAQNPYLVWAEEFEGSNIDSDTWLFESGPTNDNVHFYTNWEEKFYYTLQKPAQVTLRIFNLNGLEVETLANGFMQQGEHSSIWNAGRHPAGVYICQLRADGWLEIKKLILL